MPVRYPGGSKPGAGLAAEQWEKILEALVIGPLSHLLAWILGGSASDWDTLAEVQANLIPALLRRPLEVLGNLFDGFTGGDVDDAVVDGITFASSLLAKLFAPAQNIINAFASGYQGIAVTNANVSQLEGIGTNVANRLDALENGGTRFLFTSSTTQDFSAYSVFKVQMVGSSVPGDGGGTTNAGGGGGAHGGFWQRTFTKAELIAAGVNPAACQIVVGTSGGVTKFGNKSGGGWLFETVAGQVNIHTIDGYTVTSSPLAPGWGGQGGTDPGGSETAHAGGWGGNGYVTDGGTGGAGGAAATVNNAGGNGSPGGSTDGAGDVRGGGGGGGGGGAGEHNIFGFGQAGGNGAAGGYPGGGPGGGGGGGKGTYTTGTRGATAATANGYAIVEAA